MKHAFFKCQIVLCFEPQSGPHVTVFPQARLASEISTSPSPEPPRSHALAVAISTLPEILQTHLLVVPPINLSFK